ncbi:MAG: hypothetical protein WD873_05545, partial [Candidatus Hydrogenedentales bacterium]
MPPHSRTKSAETERKIPAFAAFRRVKRNGRTALVHPEYAAEISEALLEGAGCEMAGAAGRGVIERFGYEHGAGIIRR